MQAWCVSRMMLSDQDWQKKGVECKGQLNSEWIYDVIISPKMPTKKFPDFCPERVGQKPGNFLVGIFNSNPDSITQVMLRSNHSSLKFSLVRKYVTRHTSDRLGVWKTLMTQVYALKKKVCKNLPRKSIVLCIFFFFFPWLCITYK